MNSASLCSLAGQYNNPIPPQFLAPIDCLKIPAQATYVGGIDSMELIPVPLKHLQRQTLANHGVEMGWDGQLWTWVRGSWSSGIAFSVPDPPDPRVFWPPGSGSTSQRYGSGSVSGSFYHLEKILRNLESNYFMSLFDFLSLKNNVNIPSKSNKILKRKLLLFCFVLFFASILKVNEENPDSHQNVMDPEYWLLYNVALHNVVVCKCT
jgi:hypothetical protein